MHTCKGDNKVQSSDDSRRVVTLMNDNRSHDGDGDGGNDDGNDDDDVDVDC